MALFADYALDAAIEKIREGSRIDICHTEPTNYETLAAGYSIGYKTGLTAGAVSDRTGGGRKTTIPAFTGGEITGDEENATHWAWSDPTNSRLLAVGAIDPVQTVYDVNTFGMAAFDIGIPDAV